MDDYLEGFSENVLDWESIRHTTELDIEDPVPNVEKVDHRIHRFPRQDILMYGLMPKMEQRIYTKCRDCKLIFSPYTILYHKSCGNAPTSPNDHASEKKNKNRGGGTSKRNKGYNKEKESPSKPLKIVQVAINVKIQEINFNFDNEVKGIPDAPSPSCISNDSLTLDCDSSSPMKTSTSRTSKKSRKIKSSKEFDPDLHCGVVDAHKGPCLRSITCSNHRIQLKKIVPGRSKDIHQLIAEKRLAKERDLLNQSNPEVDRIENVNEEEEIPVVIATSLEEINEVTVSEIIDTKENIIDDTDEVEGIKQEIKQSREFDEVCQKQHKFTDEENTKTLKNFDYTKISPVKEEHFTTTVDNFRFSSRNLFGQQECMDFLENFDFSDMTSIKDECKNVDAIALDQIQPMSPLEEESSVICKQDTYVSDTVTSVPITDDQSTSLKIPDFEMEFSRGSYPRPAAVANYGMKKIGGGILFDKSQLQLQRNDILRAVNDSRVNFSLFDGTSFSRTKRNYSLTLSDSSDMAEYKQIRLDPNLNHFLMQCEVRKPFDDVLLEECLQENFGRNTFTSTIDFE